MKKLLLLFVAALLMAACATPEERAARQAENLRMVKECVGSQKYRINIRSVTPMRSTSHMVSGRWLIVDGDKVNCYLPYIGREDIPHFKSHAELRQDAKIEFKGDVENYFLNYLPKKKCGVVTFSSEYGGEKLDFSITIDNTGTAKIHLTPEKRDYIDYEGTVTAY